MSRQNRLLLRPLAGCCALMLFLLCACETTTTVKQFKEDQEKYITNKFGVAKLPAAVRLPVEQAFPENRKAQKVIIDFELTETKNDTVPQNIAGSETFYGRDHALVLIQSEFVKNGFAYRVNNAISFLGILPLDEQPVFLNVEEIVHTSWDAYVKRIKSIIPSPLSLNEKSSFSIQFDIKMRDVVVGSGWAGREYYEMHSMSVGSGRYTLEGSFGPRYPAAQVHHAITGEAMNLACSVKNEAGTVVSRRNYFYLVDYGLAVLESASSASATQKYTIKNVQFE